MFASLSRFRRQMAVLTAVALVASVLAAVPVAADMHPEPDYTATFDACGMAPDSGFTDVPSGHANAGDIDCIAYYGITKGTSATTYSPLMSVTREHMALFLTRLAGLVGIEIASNPTDPGFMDTGDLSMESQAAIAQLADLGITKGTSDTTYSPADAVTRGQMAQFIARLMDLMDPMEDGMAYGYTPSDVVDNKGMEDIGSPFTDLGTATKDAYDSITNLYELGVATGISETAYAPSASITRASMAGFMAAVLDHSNARPAGISIQASPTSGFGDVTPTVVVSYRDDMFMPVEEVSLTVFDSEAAGEFTDDGACTNADACKWNDYDDVTDEFGNVFPSDLSGTTADAMSVTYYAWMGDDKNTAFDVDEDTHASVTVTSTNDAMSIKVTTDINENVQNVKNVGYRVNLDADSSVTFTLQLVDGAEGKGDPVAKSDVEITVGLSSQVNSATVYNNTNEATLTTDDDGKAMFTVTGPASTGTANDDDERTDTVSFMAAATSGIATNPGNVMIAWTDDDAVVTSGKGSAPKFVVRDSDMDATIRASVTYYDQYGNTVSRAGDVTIAVGNAAANSDVRTVNSRGTASYTTTLDMPNKGSNVTVSFSDVSSNDPSLPPVDNVTVAIVDHAMDDSSQSVEIDAVYEDDNAFRVGGDLYSYDSDDTFVSDGKLITLDKFEDAITGDSPMTDVNVVSYDDDGSSIFSLAK